MDVVSRLLLALTLLGVVFGQVPTVVTVCLCTGQVGVQGVLESDVCSKHAAPLCSQWPAAKARKGCFLTKGQTPPPASPTTTSLPDLPGLLFAPLEAPTARWEPVLVLRPHLVLPRIREPDRREPSLRAPPSLA